MTENQIANKLIALRPMMFRNSFSVKVGEHWEGGRLVEGHWQTFNIFKGSGDYLGWTTIVVKPEMVGKKIAVFTSCEIKTERDKLSDSQRKWNRRVLTDGGIAEVWQARGEEVIVLQGRDII